MGRSEYGNTTDVAKIVAEKHFMYVINDTAGATAVGDVVNFEVGAAADGKSVNTPATTNLSAFAGVCMAIAANAKAVEVQTAGLATALVSGHSDAADGDKLITANTKDYFIRGAAADGYPAFAILCTAYTVTAAATKSVLLYCGWQNH